MANDFADIKKTLPVIGIGLGLRRELADDTLADSQHIDWLEFVPENYMQLGGMARERMKAAFERFPLVSHGVNLSIGSADDLNMDYLKELKKLLDAVESPWWSDHLCFTSIKKRYMHDLLPLPFTKEAVKHVAERIKRVQDYVQRPFLIENISYYMEMPGSQMTDAQFLAEVVETADCGLLLDVNNVYVNSLNHKFDPVEYLKQLPLDRTVQMHVAGHKRIGEYVIDTHGANMVDGVYDLLRYVLANTQVKAVLLERDQNFPEFKEITDELARIRAVARDVQPLLAAPAPGREKPTASRPALKMKPAKGGRDVRALSA